MNGNWFVVASQKTVKIFTEVKTAKKMKLIKEFDNPIGRERVRGLIRKQAGRGVRSVGLGSVRFSERKRSDPHQVAALQFAKMIARFLELEFHKNSFSSLTIFAEPHFLGTLRGELKKKIKNVVTNWVTKDLLKTPQKKLLNFLVPHVEESRSS